MNSSQTDRSLHMPLKARFLQQAKHEYSPRQRIALLLVAGLVFLVVLPYILVVLSATLDVWLSLPRFAHSFITPLAGGLMIVGGWLLGIWANYAQFTIGRGTPVPLMATQRLIVQPPYTYCRNPMALGAIVMYLGESVVLGSFSAVGLVLLGATGLLTYIKRIEEQELVARFGEDYRQYKQRTPFLIPRFRR